MVSVSDVYGLVWFREDLRIADNMALYHAAQHCRTGVIGVYIIDPTFWKKHDVAACRVDFILRGLNALKKSLHQLNIPLLLQQVTATQLIPAKLLKIMQEVNAKTLFFNQQYEFDEKQRDQHVTVFLQTKGYSCYSYDDATILPPRSVLTQQGQYFKVFTAFKRAWLASYAKQTNSLRILPSVRPQAKLKVVSSHIPASIAGFISNIDTDLWLAGEEEAKLRLDNFICNKLLQYDKTRDFPAIFGTSQLSPYLVSGMISPRVCFQAAFYANQQQLNTGNKGAVTWMSELIWREFYKHFLVAVPRVSMHRPYQLKTEELSWNYSTEWLQAWQQGKTGFPLIDAAMRQLNSTGWMHNRLRMVVAMFFCKNLFLDWRLGEKYFMQRLIDGDLAANNGGWQWCASTGVDAVPYFRVFNPLRQSRRFDSEGIFIRRYCPELAELDNKAIHQPPNFAAHNYPAPIIDLEQSRKRVIAAFKKLKEF